jgi:chromate reductase, NAD(P)H dehydrogenase (quinone)
MSTPASTPLNVLVFAASLRADSLNHTLAALAARVATAGGANVDLASMHDFDVPAYDGDLEAAEGIPAGASELHKRLTRSDAFIIASPEYNASMPGVLKNLVDWTSRFRPQPFDGRHGLLLAASPSLVGGNRGLWALRVASTRTCSRCRWPTRPLPTATLPMPRCAPDSRRRCSRSSHWPRRPSTTRA